MRTSSLFDGWKLTPMTRVFLATPSEPHEKLPESRRRARNLRLPPRVRTRWMRLAPMRVLAGWRPFSKALWFPACQTCGGQMRFGLCIPLLAVVCSLGSGGRALVTGVTRDTGEVLADVCNEWSVELMSTPWLR